MSRDVEGGGNRSHKGGADCNVNRHFSPANVGPEHEMQAMRLHIDQEGDALHLRLDESKIVESEEVSPGNAENQAVGVEILHLSKRTPSVETGKLVFETVPGVATR